MAHIVRLLRQPPILGYVLGGLLLGSNLGLGWVTSPESIELISQIGLILLLFIIGLEINLRELFRMGKAMLTLGITQFLACCLFAAWCFGLYGFSNSGGRFDLLYLSVATALSSTLIVVKLLHDKFETSSIAGRLTIGVLVLQDIWAIIFMTFQPNLLNPDIIGVARSLALGIVVVILAFAFSRYILHRLFTAAWRNPELILLTAIAWCFSVCALAETVGMSKEMGALIAGISIATFPYGTDVAAKIGGVRDFFVTLFFVSLGLKMPELNGSLLGVAGITLAIVIGGRLLSVVPTVLMLKRGLRTGIVTALNLSQISEFSLVIVSLGATYGHVAKETPMIVLISMLVASIASTYLIMFNDPIARSMILILSMMGIKPHTPEEEPEPQTGKHDRKDIVLLGCFKVGRALIEKISAEMPDLKKRLLVIDFNPLLQQEMEALGIQWKYGDLANPDTLRHFNLNESSLLISTVSDTFLKGTTNLDLFKQVRQLAPNAHMIMTAEDDAMAEKLMQEGANDVMVPGKLAADHLCKMIMNYTK